MYSSWVNVQWFQKISILLSQKHPLTPYWGNSSLASCFFSSESLAFTTPHPEEFLMTFPGGSMDTFWNHAMYRIGMLANKKVKKKLKISEGIILNLLSCLIPNIYLLSFCVTVLVNERFPWQLYKIIIINLHVAEPFSCQFWTIEFAFYWIVQFNHYFYRCNICSVTWKIIPMTRRN